MQSISEAIQQVKDAVLDGDTPETAVKDAAKDFGLAELLVSRRFAMANEGMDPGQWLEKRRAHEAAALELAQKSIERAVEKAREIATGKWHVQGPMLDLAGRVFSMNNRKYAYIVFGADNPDYAIRCIDLETQKIVNFPRSKMPEIAQQIAPQLDLAI